MLLNCVFWETLAGFTSISPFCMTCLKPILNLFLFFYIKRQRLLQTNVSILMAKRYRFGKITALGHLYTHYNPDIMTCNRRNLLDVGLIFFFLIQFDNYLNLFASHTDEFDIPVMVTDFLFDTFSFKLHIFVIFVSISHDLWHTLFSPTVQNPGFYAIKNTTI